MNKLLWLVAPAILGVGAVIWLSFFVSARLFERDISQAQRAAQNVQAVPLPKGKLEIQIVNKPEESVWISNAYFDDGDLWLYYVDRGHQDVEYIRLWYKLLAPDGTVIAGDDIYPSIYGINGGADNLSPGERAEVRLKLPSDPRAIRLQLRMTNQAD